MARCCAATPRAAPSSTGALRITVRNGDMIGGTATAKNVLLQDAPAGQLAGDDQARRLDAHHRGRSGRASSSGAREPEHVREDHLHLQGQLRRSTSGWRRATARPRYSAGPQISTPAERRLPAAQRQRRRARTSPRARPTARTGSRSRAPITDLGDPETMKVGIKVSNTPGHDDALRRLRLLPRRLLGQDRADDDGHARQRHAGRQARLVLDVAEGRADRRRRRAATAWPRSPTRSTAAPSATYEGPFTRRRRRRARGRVLRHRQGGERRDGQDGRVPRRRHRADVDGHGRGRPGRGAATVTIDADDGDRLRRRC